MTELFPIPATIVSAYVTLTEESQLSVAVAWPVFAGKVLASHSTVTSAGDAVNTGAVTSLITTFCV